MSYPLRRTASEESVQRTTNGFEMVQVTNNNRRKRPVVHRKGRAPNPPKGSKTSPSIIRSNSVNQVRHWEQNQDWYRSKSTTRLNSEDSEDSCSTLSDEDSTPHVSRSNSYGRSEENSFNHGEERGEDDTTYDIYLHDERTLNVSTNLDAAYKNNVTSKAKHREFDSFSCETPPGYEESIYRQRILKLQGRPNSAYLSSSPARASPNPRVPEKVIEKQVELSAKAKALFEESLRQYETTNDLGVTPPPLPPKTDRPPLPPKQRSRRSTEHESSDDQTYVNSAEINRSRNRTRLSITSPVHHPSPSPVSNPQPSPAPHQSSSDDKDSSEFVYGSYFRSGTKVSVPVIHETEFTPAPTLPPKDARTPDRTEAKRNRSMTSTKIVSTSGTSSLTIKSPMKSVETQTDESDFVILYPDGTEDESFTHTDSEYSPESNRSMSPDFGTGPVQNPNYYSPDPQQPHHFYLRTNTLFERPVSAQSVGGLRHAGRRKLEPVQSVPSRTQPDPVIAGEINWSVSQLRTLFNQGLAAQAGNSYDSATDPYRNNRQSAAMDRRMDFHHGMAGNYSSLYGGDNQHTDSDQESYV